MIGNHADYRDNYAEVARAEIVSGVFRELSVIRLRDFTDAIELMMILLEESVLYDPRHSGDLPLVL